MVTDEAGACDKAAAGEQRGSGRREGGVGAQVRAGGAPRLRGGGAAGEAEGPHATEDVQRATGSASTKKGRYMEGRDFGVDTVVVICEPWCKDA